MKLREKIDRGQFAVLAEIEPPKGVDLSAMQTHAQRVKNRVDAFLVPEMSNAVMRMSSLGGAMVLQSRGMEAVMQLCCRDRNRLALQADLLAGAACGIGTVMAVQGEETSFGDHHQARPVYDIDLLGLLEAIRGLQGGHDMAGIELSGAPRFLVGAKIDSASKDRSPEIEAEAVRGKIDAGAEFFVTPPLFDPQVMEPLRKRLAPLQPKIVATVLLLKSAGMARYMARNLGHIHLPPPLIDRLQSAPDKPRESVAIAAEVVRRVRDDGYAGVLLATIGWEHLLPEILERI